MFMINWKTSIRFFHEKCATLAPFALIFLNYVLRETELDDIITNSEQIFRTQSIEICQ